jgi:PAS domain S-box-containing protein
MSTPALEGDAILIVDDREDNLIGLEAILRDLGPQIVRARSGQEALRAAFDRDFAVILLDVRMPDLDGFETASLIRRRKRSEHTPIILITAADASPQDITRGYAVGAVDYLFKPFMPEVLRAKVKIFLELHRKSRELRESELRYQTLTDISPVGIYRSGADTQRSYVNRRWCEITGLSPEEGRGRGWLRIIHPGDRDRFLATWDRAVRDGVPFACEYRILRPDGAVLWALGQARAELGPGGDVVGYVGTVTDITARKLAEEALRASEDRFRSLVENIPGAVYRCEAEPPFATCFVTDQIRDITGYPASHFASNPKAYRELIHPEDRPMVTGAVEKALAAGDSYAVDYRIVHRDGRLRWVFDKGGPSRGSDGSPRTLDGVLFEITDRKRAEEKVLERTAELQEALRELDSFSYTVAHDLRAPLRAMCGFSEAILEDYGTSLEPTCRKYAGLIRDGSRRMDVLIQDLLAYSRLAREEIPLEPVSLEETIGDALKTLGAEIRSRGAAVEVAPPMPPVLANRMVLVRVVTNLLSNAVKFVPSETVPRVRVWAEARGPRTRLWVEDNGIGIAPEHHERVFRVFERLHRQEQYPGTGIGLAIVQKSMARMGGASGVESEPGKGSRFWIEIPTLEKSPVPSEESRIAERTSRPS